MDWAEFDKLCAIQASQKEIAFWFGVHPETIDVACRRDHKVGFTELHKRKSVYGIISARRSLFQQVQKGDMRAIVYVLERGNNNDSITVNVGGEEVKTETKDLSLEEFKGLAINYGYFTDGNAEDKLRELRELNPEPELTLTGNSEILQENSSGKDDPPNDGQSNQ